MCILSLMNNRSYVKKTDLKELFCTISQVQQIVTWLYCQEESPGCYKTVFHLTNGRSNTRESATEIRLPLMW